MDGKDTLLILLKISLTRDYLVKHSTEEHLLFLRKGTQILRVEELLASRNFRKEDLKDDRLIATFGALGGESNGNILRSGCAGKAIKSNIFLILLLILIKLNSLRRQR